MLIDTVRRASIVSLRAAGGAQMSGIIKPGPYADVTLFVMTVPAARRPKTRGLLRPL